jgi:phenylacetate-coenzyme A ligase PaaK-like adenylate-forming protein
MSPIRERSKADQVREHLLPLTLRHAVENSDFYRQRLGNLAPTLSRISELSELPLLHKRDLVDHLDELRTFDTYPDFLMFTSGTTGNPLPVPVYRSEIEAGNQLLLPPIRAALSRDFPLTVTVLRVGHGNHVLNPEVPSIPCHINYGLDQLIRVLSATHWVNGRYRAVEHLELNVLNLREITAKLLSSGVEPASFGLTRILTSGWYLSPHERARLEETWRVELVDRYGVTEVNGDAKWCRTCQAYHFDFLLIPEFLDPETARPVESGVAHMVITGLFPFNQAVPKIRYFVDDLVEVSEASCGIAEKAVRFLARSNDCVRTSHPRADGMRFQLFSADVAETLASIPDVMRMPKTGFLKFRLSTSEALQARIDIELTYEPKLFPNRVAELRGVITRSLHNKRQALEKFDVCFQSPGELRDITKV